MSEAGRGGGNFDATSSLIAFFSLMLIIVAWGCVAMLVRGDREAEVERVESENAFIARAFEEQARRILKSAENGLTYMKRELEKNSRITPSLHTYCDLLKEDLWATQVAVSDEEGNLVYSAVPLKEPINIAEREHFAVHRGRADVGTFIGKPLRMKATGSFAFFLTKRLQKADGSFGGIVSVGLDPAYFGRVFESSLVGNEHNGIVVGTDHIVRVRFNTVLKTVGDDISSFSPVFRYAANSPTGAYEMAPNSDKIERMVSYRAMPDYPLIVIVSSVKSISMSTHRERKAGYYFVGLLLTSYILIFAVFLTLASRQTRQKNLLLGEELAERRRAEEELEESRALFAGFMDHMPVLVWLLDERGAFLYVNRAAREYFGRDLTGSDASRIDSPAMRALLAHLGPDQTRGTSHIFEASLTREDGASHVFEVMRFEVLRGDKPAHLGFIARDLTRRKEAEAQHLELERKFQQAQKMESLGLLAGGIAHDFNNLLLGVVGNIDLALSSTDEAAPSHPALKRAEAAAQRAAELTNQMLAYSGRGRFVIERVDLSELVSQMAPLLSTVHSKLVTIRYDLVAGLEPTEGDATQLRQVVMNLITNAADSYQGGEGVVRVSTGRASQPVVNAEGQKLELYFRVSDDGSGMDESTRAKIYEPFYTTKATGRGLGLAAVQGIVRGHRGVIELESEPGRGTTFTVYLPAAKGETAAPPVRPDAQGPPASLEAPPGSVILLVDDEETVRTTATPILEMKGYKVLTACDGVEAMEVFRAHADEISAVILDITMPKMGGAEAYARMREINPDIPVLFSSGFSEEDYITRFAKSGAAGFIQKPYRVRALIEKVGQAVRSGARKRGQ